MSITTDTEFKFEEAKYFLSQLELNQKNVELFFFNLSAFLSAARSVTFLIQAENSNINGFKDWYAINSNNKIFKTFNSFRVEAVHRQILHLGATIEVGGDLSTQGEFHFKFHTDNMGSFGRESHKLWVDNISKMTNRIKKEKIEWYFILQSEKIPVIEASKEYLTELSTLIANYNKKFPKRE